MSKLPGWHALLAAIVMLGAAGAQAATAPTYLYTSSNLASGNAVIQFEQSAGGTLAVVAEYPTGGAGTGGGLGNQGAIAADDEFLFVVDAGSNEVSSFRFADDALVFAGRVASGGVRPVSVTVDRDVVYVLNAGSDSIAGFTVAPDGELSPIPGSTQALSASGAGAAQISFSKDGRVLVISERATNRLVTFQVDRDGIAHERQVFPSPGQTPFGFAFTSGRRVLVSEAAGGQPLQSSVTSWRLSPGGALSVGQPAEPTLQTAACWVAVTPNGRFAFTTNTGSSTVTAFRVRGDRLARISPDGATASTGTGSAPIDMAISADGRFLHTLNAGTDSIASFRIEQRGTLTRIGGLKGLPDGATGLLAR